MTLREVYVRGLRGIRHIARLIGVLDCWTKRSHQSRVVCWSRSLLAVYDPLDLATLDLPWWTFEAADLVNDYLKARPNARVFEWGSGASTVWLAKRAQSVVSIEHDARWASDVQSLAPNNVQVRLVAPLRSDPSNKSAVFSEKRGFNGLDFSEYVSAIENEVGLFDVIVIDGRVRQACLPYAVRHLAPGGLIVFDNVERPRYREAISAAGPTFLVCWTRGLTPSLPYPTRTALITTHST